MNTDFPDFCAFVILAMLATLFFSEPFLIGKSRPPAFTDLYCLGLGGHMDFDQPFSSGLRTSFGLVVDTLALPLMPAHVIAWIAHSAKWWIVNGVFAWLLLAVVLAIVWAWSLWNRDRRGR